MFAKDNEYSGNEIADYRDLQGDFNKRVQQNKKDPSFTVFIGLTHPRKYDDSDNMYSIQDLASVAYLAEASGVQFGACIVTPDRQVNMCFMILEKKSFIK